jgi:hypothetical protein
VEQWTTRLGYPDKQRRESDSVNWLSEVNEFAREHLQADQLHQFMHNHGTAMNSAKRYEFATALKNAGSEGGTDDHNIAFEIACKVKLLERFRSEPTRASGKFQVRCGPDVYADNILVGNVPARYLQAEISIKSGTVHGCRAYLREIRGETKRWEGHEQLTFQPSESPDTLSKAIFASIKYRLDILLLISTGGIVVCNHNRVWTSFPNLNDLFSAHGSYNLRIDIGGEDASGETFLLCFNWTGNWQTSFLTEAKRLS